jgi:hypothetical protein
MNLTPLAALIALIAVFSIYRSISRVRADKMGLRAGLFWIILWTALAFFAAAPAAIDSLMAVVQMGDRRFFFAMCGVLVSLALIYELTTEVDRLRRQVARVVQEQALAGWDAKHKRGEGQADGP